MRNSDSSGKIPLGLSSPYGFAKVAGAVQVEQREGPEHGLEEPVVCLWTVKEEAQNEMLLLSHMKEGHISPAP